MRRRQTPLKQVVLVLALWGAGQHRAHGAPFNGREERKGAYPDPPPLPPRSAPRPPVDPGRGVGRVRVGDGDGGGAARDRRGMFELAALCNRKGWTLAPEEGRGGGDRYVLTMGAGKTKSTAADDGHAGSC